jgi:hypothetical protein
LYDCVRGAPRLQVIATYVVIWYTYKAIRTHSRLRPGPPPERANIHRYIADLGMCTEDSCYAEVGFNTIMYYVQLGVPSEKTNALSLRDR